MRFERYVSLKREAYAEALAPHAEPADAKAMNPILLAYIGDAIFSLYVRLRLLPTSSHVRVLNDLSMQYVSAVCQCRAMEALAQRLTEEEAAVFHRARNAKSSVPKSASVHEYRMATAFEALLGFIFLEHREERLEEILEQSFAIISESMEK